MPKRTESRPTDARMIDATSFPPGFKDEVGNAHMAPLWDVLHTLVPKRPSVISVAHHWPFRTLARPLLMKAGEIISAEKAERRVLILENPALKGRACATDSLYAGLQLVLPGETAPAHRHTQSALRLVIEGADGHTTIEGERTEMAVGDLVITPAWHWHDHDNDSSSPMIWLDVLDIPLINFLGTGFAEANHTHAQTQQHGSSAGSCHVANNLAPVDWKASDGHSPVFRYPYGRTREALQGMSRHSPADLCHGFKLRYVNPANGGHVTPTMAAFAQLLPSGFRSQPYLSTEGTVFCVIEGEGCTRVGEGSLLWKPGDVFVVPSWNSVTHETESGAVLFSASDRAAQEALGLWRELRTS